MSVSSFARFKGGFTTPTMEAGPEALERDLRDLADYLAADLPSEGIECARPEWADFEYQIDCGAGERRYELSVSFDYLNWDWFEVSYGPSLGFFERLFGGSEEAEMARLSGALHTVLGRRQGVEDLRWYRKPLDDPDKGYDGHPQGAG